jgi:hypothetical protein
MSIIIDLHCTFRRRKMNMTMGTNPKSLPWSTKHMAVNPLHNLMTLSGRIGSNWTYWNSKVACNPKNSF